MQIRHQKTALQPTEGIQKVTALAWSANSRRLAVVTTDRIVHLYDENAERKDKFSTKPSDAKGPKTYVVKGVSFSPDSSKLAIAQSDNIVFVYKLGLEWGDKKSICNKFHQSSSVTCVAWPHQQLYELVFGVAEGKVKVGQLRTNKPSTLYVHPEGSMVVSMAAGPDGQSIISGHLDGSLYRFTFEQNGVGPVSQKFGQHGCVPTALSWGGAVVAGGSDGKVLFYGEDGEIVQQFDFAQDSDASEFNAASFNPSGETVVVGSFNRFHVFQFSTDRQQWEMAAAKNVENLYTVSAITWKPDGSRIAIGNLTGGVQLYEACLRRYRYKGKFEMTYVSQSQVIIKRLSNGSRIAIRSYFGYEITRINVYRDNFVVAYTSDTLILSNIETCKSSEVEWMGTTDAKFFFENPEVCIVYNAGELSLVEYGKYEILGSCRTEHVSPYLISVRINEGHTVRNQGQNKKVAYLIDAQTARVLDLMSGVTVATINHDSRIDWLELNTRGTHLLFRDKKRQLHLYTISKQERNTLLTYCSYVQWVPESDVVVAQNRGNLCVWYSIDKPDRVTVFPIKGEVEDIERSHGRTEIIVDEGINTVSYALDEALIEFGTAVDARDYEAACDILDPLELTPETEAMWQQLSAMALEDHELAISERCFAALGDVCKARYLRKVVKLSSEVAKEMGGGDATNHFQVRANLAKLDKQWKTAERYLLEQGRVEETMQMYTECHRWRDAITVAEAKGHPEANTLRENYFQWLLQTGQEEEAGSVKEAERDLLGAISLYLQGGLPARAAQVVNNNQQFPWDSALLENYCRFPLDGWHARASR